MKTYIALAVWQGRQYCGESTSSMDDAKARAAATLFRNHQAEPEQYKTYESDREPVSAPVTSARYTTDPRACSHYKPAYGGWDLH